MDPQVQGTVITLATVGIVWLGKVGICYLRLKFSKNIVKSGREVCSQHAYIVQLLKEIRGYYEEEKQIKLYTEAIKRAGNSK